MNLLRISSLLLVLLLEPAYGSRVEPKLFTRRAALCFTPAAGLLAAQPALADGDAERNAHELTIGKLNTRALFSIIHSDVYAGRFQI